MGTEQKCYNFRTNTKSSNVLYCYLLFSTRHSLEALLQFTTQKRYAEEAQAVWHFLHMFIPSVIH